MPTTHKPYDIESITRQIDDDSYNNIYYFEGINSTNSWLQEYGKCGDICISERQANGRGRRGNQWVSPANGNIYLSFCYCLTNKIQHQSLLSLLTGIAITEALDDIGLKNHGVKWPNDIYWDQKKLGGVLIETSNQSDKFIIGIGVNIFLPEIENNEIKQNISSVNNAMLGRQFSRDKLLIKIIHRLTEHLKNFESIEFRQFIRLWQKWDILHKKSVSFLHQGSIVSGTVIGIDQHGRIGILNTLGDTHFYASADIQLDKKSIQNDYKRK